MKDILGFLAYAAPTWLATTGVNLTSMIAAFLLLDGHPAQWAVVAALALMQWGTEAACYITDERQIAVQEAWMREKELLGLDVYARWRDHADKHPTARACQIQARYSDAVRAIATLRPFVSALTVLLLLLKQ